MPSLERIESVLLDTYQAAHYLGLHPGTLANWRSRHVGRLMETFYLTLMS